MAALSARNLILLIAATLGTVLVLALLVNIFQRQEEGRVLYPRVVEVDRYEPDPAVWGKNFPHHYDGHMATLTTETFEQYSRYGRYGGSEAYSKLDKYPNLRRLFAGYPFEVEYNVARGHLHALPDMLEIARLGDAKPGTCMTCKSGHVPGLMAELGPADFYQVPVVDMMERFDITHSISCVDCHEPDTMDLVITRPAFREAMARRGIDVDRASRRDMRTYVCAQCHVEYYFDENAYLIFPWDEGLRVDDMERYFDARNFRDWVHAESGAPLVKMQHPEFELWSTGIHARAGVGCPDCHMPFTRVGAAKITDHKITTPLRTVDRSCLTCHRASEDEMRSRVLEIQDRTFAQMERAENAIIAAIDAIVEAKEAGATDEQLADPRNFHRRAYIRWDYINAENSMGFHSGGEAARVLGDSIDFARQGEIAARELIAEMRRNGGPAGPERGEAE
jgi:nitrite reductase (cytochrome c-552)